MTRVPTPNEWPERIRRLRRRLGKLTQAELATHMGLSRSAIEKWEEGLHVPQRYVQGAIEALEQKAANRVAARKEEKRREREKREAMG